MLYEICLTLVLLSEYLCEQNRFTDAPVPCLGLERKLGTFVLPLRVWQDRRDLEEVASYD